MTRHAPPAATCTVRAWKAGLFSAVGHDVELRVARFWLEVDDDGIRGEFDASSLEVAGAVRHDHVEPGALSAKDKVDILDNVRKVVFAKHQPAKITFRCDEVVDDGDELHGEGELAIPPFRRALPFRVRIAHGRAVCELKLNQPDWGITPFKAALGGLRVQPEVTVRIEIPWAG